MSVIYDSAGNIVEQQDWDNRTKAGEQLAQYVDELEAERDRLAAELAEVKGVVCEINLELAQARAVLQSCVPAVQREGDRARAGTRVYWRRLEQFISKVLRATPSAGGPQS